MAVSIKKWLSSKETSELLKTPEGEIVNKYFFRDPNRAIYYNRNCFLSPADGIVIYAKEVSAKEPLVEVKGKNFTVQDLLYDKSYRSRSLVIGIFMTFYDVHINRIPTDGLLKIRPVPPIYSYNAPMLNVELDILDKLNINHNHLEYLFTNERLVNEIYVPHFNQNYYVVQIADKEVDSIVNFTSGDEFMNQGERFGMIRWGSQVDLIIPLTNPHYKFISVIEPLLHVEAGVDKLVKVVPIKHRR